MRVVECLSDVGATTRRDPLERIAHCHHVRRLTLEDELCFRRESEKDQTVWSHAPKSLDDLLSRGMELDRRFCDVGTTLERRLLALELIGHRPRMIHQNNPHRRS